MGPRDCGRAGACPEREDELAAGAEQRLGHLLLVRDELTAVHACRVSAPHPPAATSSSFKIYRQIIKKTKKTTIQGGQAGRQAGRQAVRNERGTHCFIMAAE